MSQFKWSHDQVQIWPSPMGESGTWLHDHNWSGHPLCTELFVTGDRQRMTTSAIYVGIHDQWSNYSTGFTCAQLYSLDLPRIKRREIERVWGRGYAQRCPQPYACGVWSFHSIPFHRSIPSFHSIIPFHRSIPLNKDTLKQKLRSQSQTHEIMWIRLAMSVGISAQQLKCNTMPMVHGWPVVHEVKLWE